MLMVGRSWLIIAGRGRFVRYARGRIDDAGNMARPINGLQRDEVSEGRGEYQSDNRDRHEKEAQGAGRPNGSTNWHHNLQPCRSSLGRSGTPKSVPTFLQNSQPLTAQSRRALLDRGLKIRPPLEHDRLTVNEERRRAADP